ncbi:MAG: Uncharacterized protein FD135_4175, partial [Comamonadaceae bacterium]
TFFITTICAAFWGLSPLARGNPSGEFVQSAGNGPIPARAGEPLMLDHILSHSRAYPRSRGGTVMNRDGLNVLTGLSPLARGNRMNQPTALGLLGPIPARAGEPQAQSAQAAASGAYPRSRGGT